MPLRSGQLYRRYSPDFVREEQRNLKGMKLREFAELMFNKCSTLKRYRGKVDEIYKQFTNYKFSVPVGGLILLNPKLDKCVMVKGYKSGSSWWGWYKLNAVDP